MRLRISVGEPWDFRSDLGDNVLDIFDARKVDASGKEVILGKCSPFDHAGRRIADVAVTARHVGGRLFVGHSVSVSFKTNDETIGEDAYRRRDWSASSWLIGSIVSIDGH